MALPILAKTITSALVKTGSDAKNESKKVSAEKLLPGSTDNNVKVSKFRSRKPKTYRNKFETSKFLPPSKIEEQFDMKKMDDLLMSLIDNTNDLKKATKKDVDDEKEKNIQKNNVKSKVKRNKREENIEEKKTVAKISKPMKFKSPDFLKDILGMGGRLVLATGIMSILNYLTDPEKKDGLIQFLTDHMDKIILGTLATLGALFVASFAPVIGIVGSLLGLLSPIITIMGGIITSMALNPAVLTVLGLLGGGMLLRDLLYRLEGPVSEFYEEHIQSRRNRGNYGERADEGQFIRSLRDNYGRISTKKDREKLTDKEKTTARFLSIYEEKLKELVKLKRSLRGAKGPRKRKIQNQIKIVEEVLNGIASQLEIGGKSLSELQVDYEKDGTLPQTSIQKGSPMVKPQTNVLPGLKLGGLQGHSGSVAYAGQKRASLSTEYSPFAQSDIDEQNLSIISGMGDRESTGTKHKGYDIPAEEGTPIRAYFPGVILRNMPNVKGYGNLVEWKDDVYGQTHMFAHMMEPSTLSPGTKFKKGTVLGKIGSTGISEGPHLHWEIGPKGAEVEPGEWVRKHPQIKVSPNQPKSNQDQNVSSQTSYEKSGTQVAMVQVPTPVPMPSGGGPGGEWVIIGGGTGLYVNRYILATHHKEA